ncbi:MAG: hypothetical protein ABIQ44_02770, partial [Chloroflexia bacterium]
MIDLVSKRVMFILISLVIIIPGVIAVVLGGLKPGIDFTGGKRLTLVPLTSEAYDSLKFKASLASIGYDDAVVKAGSIGEGKNITNTITMDIPRIAELPDTQRDDALSEVARQLIQDKLVAGSQVSETINLAPTTVLTGTPTVAVEATATSAVTGTGSLTDTGTTTTPTAVPAITAQVSRWRIDEKAIVDDITVGPTVGNELIVRAFYAVVLASIAILIYLTVVFRKVPNAFRYGMCAIFALIHDVLVVVGVFAILGLIFGIEIDAL